MAVQQQLDTQKMASLKVMDFNYPPTKDLGYVPFPKAVYLHPSDKKKTHKEKLVYSEPELKEAIKAGWQTKPHVPFVDPEAADDFQADLSHLKK